MSLPPFFEQAPTITVFDPLSRFLGAGDGTLSYGYQDAVKLAGHSCPTVAGTWLMIRAALKALWPDSVPVRGAIRVYFPEQDTAGTTGVQAAIATLVTGARGDDGFKGLAGHFDRRSLLFFDTPLNNGIGFQRQDNGTRVQTSFNSGVVPAEPEMRRLLQKWADGLANSDEIVEFGNLWQNRVKRILLDHADDPMLVRVTDWA